MALTQREIDPKRIGSAYLSRKNVHVPHDKSTIFVVLLAFLAPLATFLWDLHSIYQSKDTGYEDLYQHTPRFLQQNNYICTLNYTAELNNATGFYNTTTNTTEYTQQEEFVPPTPPSTMAAIATSLYIAFSIGFFSFALYEVYRRDPIVGKYVYDRKRLTQPDRTPPPLMLSRSLWTGNEGTGKTKGWFRCCSWWKVRPAFFELYFLTLDERYLRYSQAAEDARKEREGRGYLTNCRAGCYHKNCCNEVRIPAYGIEGEDEYFVDEDGYCFYPGFNHELGFKHEVENYYEIPRFSPRASALGSGTGSPMNKYNKGTSLADLKEHKYRYSIQDLYPEDFRSALTKNKSKASRNLVIRVSDNGEDSSSDEYESAVEEIPSTRRSISRLHVDTSTTYTQNASDKDTEDSPELAPPPPPAEDDTPLEYPYRLVTFFLPPGFHNWTNAGRFLGEFFFISRFKRQMAEATGKIFGNRLGAASFRRQEIRIHEELLVLTPAEEELLRCAGLDTYLMIRFARFGFDVCFYPFLFACATVFPIYLSCDTQSIFSVEEGQVIASATGVIDGFFNLTINRIPPNSWKMYWVVAFTFFLYFFVLRRLWLEWEIVIKLRHRYLSNGDENFHTNPTYLKKYRNSVMVECVPKSHRTDSKVRQVFEQLFPGQIESAEMLIDTKELEGTLDKRRNYIEKFENAEAKYQYQHWKYYSGDRNCCTKDPREPKTRSKCCGKKENALDFYKDRIKEYDDLAEADYDKLVESRLNNHNPSLDRAESAERRSSFDLIASAVREVLGLRSSDLFCSTAVVEFKSITAKQSAVQCNLFGQSHYFVTEEAPDPRDILWSNMICQHRYIETRRILVEFLLVICVIFWGAFVAWITDQSNKTIDGLQLMNVDLTRFRLYIPTWIISLILLWIPRFLFLFAMNIIKFKSFSQCDKFVIKWNTAFRITNIVFIFFSISLVEAINCFKDEPEKFIQFIAIGVLKQSSFLLNLIIIATGQETMLQLLQWRSIIKQAVCRPLINFNSRSRRCLNSLNEPPPFEQACIFGYFSPVLSYCLIIGMLYSYMQPVMLGACSFFFWMATKVHTHNALYVYCEPFSGGGQIFYYWNRIVFATLYSSIVILFGILAIKGFYKVAIAFVLIMLLVTVMVDKSITKKFILNSFHLPIKLARVHDDEERALIKRSGLKKDGGENFMYRNPMLNQCNWDEKPFRWM